VGKVWEENSKRGERGERAIARKQRTRWGERGKGGERKKGGGEGEELNANNCGEGGARGEKGKEKQTNLSAKNGK